MQISAETFEELKLQIHMTQIFAFLVFSPKSLPHQYYSDICMPVVIAAEFIIVKPWKQPEYLWTDEWLNKMLCLYIMDYYLTIKKGKFETF